MTNMERIQQMDEKELAELLVKETLQQDVDYDWDESPFAIYETVYGLPNGEIYYNYDDALRDCIKWLQEDFDAASEG